MACDINQCHFGDCMDILTQIDPGSVQTCVTSPPYWRLRDYGVDGQIGLEETPEEFVDNLVQVFRLVRNALAKDGTLWMNLGDCYASSGNGGHQGNKSRNFAGVRGRVGCQKGIPKRPAPGYKDKDLMGMPWRVALALQADGWYLRSDIIWHKPNPMPESVRDRPTKSHEYIFLLSKSKKYYYDADAIKEPTTYFGPDSGVGFDYADPSKKRSRHKTPAGWNTRPGGHQGKAGRYPKGNAKTFRGGQYTNNNKFDNHESSDRDSHGNKPNESGLRNKRTVWTVATQAFPGAHFATFPEELIKPCILAGSRPGDVVLDPFFGSGTTGQVAMELGRDYLGIELNPEYEQLQRDRIKQRGLAL